MILFLKNILQGNPFKHPVHPALVHFPISLFLVGLVFDIASWISGQGGWLAEGAYYSLVGGEIMGFLAATVGVIDWSDIRADHRGKKIATIHMVMNLSGLAIFGVNIALRGTTTWISTPLAWLSLSALGVSIILISGYLGGRMIYGDGIAVGRYRRGTRSSSQTVRAAAIDFSDGYVNIADAEKLKDGETLRVSVDGEVLAIARLGDEFFAFNEFCTHRFGPLSEGALADEQIECPWHRSCFDLRTGKVVQGPAKVDIKIYPIKVEGGKIKIQWTREHSAEEKAFSE